MYNTTRDKFAEDVLERSHQHPVVVMFHAAWCGPCKSMKPMIERLAGELPFELVGVDGGAERELAALEGVRGVPTIIVYANGVALASMSGARTETDLRNFFAANGVTL